MIRKLSVLPKKITLQECLYGLMVQRVAGLRANDPRQFPCGGFGSTALEVQQGDNDAFRCVGPPGIVLDRKQPGHPLSTELMQPAGDRGVAEVESLCLLGDRAPSGQYGSQDVIAPLDLTSYRNIIKLQSYVGPQKSFDSLASQKRPD